MKKFLEILLVGAVLLTTTAGCMTSESRRQLAAQLREKIATKKQKYAALDAKLRANTLNVGTSAQEVRSEFGEPDDIYRAASNVSDLEFWTYTSILNNGQSNEWQSVRLYFSKDKLLSWRY